MATISDSAPMPKTKRPATIMGNAAPNAVMNAPIRQSTPKISSALRVPMRSIRMPPSTTVKMLGKL